MVAYVKSRSDLEIELHEQLQALRASAAAYDAGNLWEAKRLAVTAFILVEDAGRKQQSLLTQLNLKQSIQFTSTVKPADANSPLPLCIINVDMPNGTFTYSPFLHEHSTHRTALKFSRWYSEPVFGIEGGKKLSRKNLIYALRNQMGGGHVDDHIKDEAVHWLTRGAHKIECDGGWQDEDGKVLNEVPFAKPMQSGSVPNGHLATMRQIAWELDYTISQTGL
jgi:hypothetical protein